MNAEQEMISHDLADAQRYVNDALTDIEDISVDSINWDAPEIESAADAACETLEELNRLITAVRHRLSQG